jgi:hypothetical protein
MGELTTFVRIGLYILSGYLLNKGLPPQLADMLTNDPSVADAVSTVLAAVAAGGSLLWWRMAKRFGWAT